MPSALEWLHRLDGPAARPLLQNVVSARRLVLLRAWPASARQKAHELLTGEGGA